LAALVCLGEFAEVIVLGVLVGELHDGQAVGAHFEFFLVKVLGDLLLVVVWLGAGPARKKYLYKCDRLEKLNDLPCDFSFVVAYIAL
jgi:hypothetical protein